MKRIHVMQGVNYSAVYENGKMKFVQGMNDLDIMKAFREDFAVGAILTFESIDGSEKYLYDETTGEYEFPHVLPE